MNWMTVSFFKIKNTRGKKEKNEIRIYKNKNLFINFINRYKYCRVAQRKRAGLITRRSVDRNHALLQINFKKIRIL